MKMLKCIHLFAGLLFASVALAADPVVLWDGDFSETTKEGADGQTYTLTVNTGNTVDSKGLFITVGAEKGVLVDWNGAQIDEATIIIRFSDLTPNASKRQILACTSCDSKVEGCGALVKRSDENSTIFGCGRGKTLTGSNAMVFPSAGEVKSFAIVHKSVSDTGTLCYHNVGGEWFKAYENSTLRWSADHIHGFNIGGPRGTASADYGTAEGMKIFSIAVFKAILSQEEIAAYNWTPPPPPPPVVAPTLSIGFDGSYGASKILGGTAPSSQPADWGSPVFVAVHGSESNKAYKSNRNCRANQTLTSFNGSQSWTMNFVAQLNPQTQKVALFGIGGLTYNSGKGFAVGQNADNSIDVEWYGFTGNKAHDKLITAVGDTDLTADYHAYTLTYDSSDKTYAFYIDGMKCGVYVDSAGAYASGAGNVWCVGNVYGGGAQIGMTHDVADNAIIDDFAIWCGTCLSDAEVEKVAEAFGLFAPAVSVTISENKTWTELWNGDEPDETEAVEICFENGAILTFDKPVKVFGITLSGAAKVAADDISLECKRVSAESLELTSGSISLLSSGTIGSLTIDDGAEFAMEGGAVSVAGPGKFVKIGTGELNLNNNSGGYAVDGATIDVESGKVTLNDGNGDPVMRNAIFVIGENGELDNYGWLTIEGVLAVESDYDKSIFTNKGGRNAKLQGSPAIVKKGIGAVTIGSNEENIPSVTVLGGSIGFDGTQPLSYAEDATFDFTALAKTATPVIGNLNFAIAQTYKFPADWSPGEPFALCSGAISDIPEGGIATDFTFYLGEAPKTANFNLSSGGSVYYTMGVVDFTPEGDYRISALNGLEIHEGYSARVTMRPNSTLTIDEVAKVATVVVCDGNLVIVGKDGVEPTRQQLSALNLDGVKGKIVKGWLAVMGVININLSSGDETEFPMPDNADDDGMLAGNTPNSSWINVTGAAGTLTDIVEWKTVEQESATISDMTFTWDANLTYSVGHDNIEALKGYLDDGNPNGATLTLTGVPYRMFDVIVYFSTDQGGGLYHPLTVNGFGYTGDMDAHTTITGNALWGDNAERSGVAEGVNALRVRDLEGDVTIHTAPRASSTRGCVAAIQIVEVPYKEYRRSFEAEEGVDVRTSDLNAYIAEGDKYTGPFALTLNGGKFIADADFDCVALTINSATDLIIEKADGYSISADEIAKISINDFGGDKATFINVPLISGTIPDLGKIYRWEGTAPLATIPFAEIAVAGTLEIACPIASADAFAIANTHNRYVFDEGFELTAQKLIIGNNKGSVQNFTQNGGAITLTQEYTGDNTTTEMPFLLAHWDSTCTYDLIGGSITAESGNVMFGRDGKIAMTVGGGSTAATFKARGISWDQRTAESSLTILENGVVQLGVGGIDFHDGKKVVLAGGKLEIYDDATISMAMPMSVDADSTIDVSMGKVLALNGALLGSGGLIKTGEGTLRQLGSLANYTGAKILEAGVWEFNAGGEGVITVKRGTELKLRLSEEQMEFGYTAREVVFGEGADSITFIKPDGTEETVQGRTYGAIVFALPAIANATVVLDGEGSEIIDGKATVRPGSDITITYTADVGYSFDDPLHGTYSGRTNIWLSYFDLREAPNLASLGGIIARKPVASIISDKDIIYYFDFANALTVLADGGELMLYTDALFTATDPYVVLSNTAITLNGFTLSGGEAVSFLIDSGVAFYLYNQGDHLFDPDNQGMVEDITFKLLDGILYSYAPLAIDSAGEPYVKVESDKYGYTYVSANKVATLVEELKKAQPFALPESEAWLVEAVKSMGYEVVSTMSVEKPSEYRLVISPDEAVNGSKIENFEIAEGKATITIPAKSNLYYGLEYANNPAFSGSRIKWAEKGATELSAEAQGANMFYRVLITDKDPTIK